MENTITTASLLTNISKYGLLILGAFVFIAALIFGANEYGGGLEGIIKNSPNALPWALLLVTIYIAWRWELVGGIIITVLGIGLVYFFNFSGPNFWWSTFAVTLLIPLLGLLLLVGWYLGEKKKAG